MSIIVEAFFGLPAAVAMHEVGEAAFKRQCYQSLIAQQLYLKTMIESWRTTNIMLSIWWMYVRVYIECSAQRYVLSGGASVCVRVRPCASMRPCVRVSEARQDWHCRHRSGTVVAATNNE